MANSKQRVVVVTGGAAGIGAAIAEELGRVGAFVVTLDPVVNVDGSSRIEDAEQTTAQKIVDAGGTARASNTSVTDHEAVQALFTALVEEFGSLDAVVNVAGISRPTDFASGTEEDWAAVLSVHLDGYLNVLRAALPIMTKAGHGQILGVTSGSGWRPANVGAYGCAKRAGRGAHMADRAGDALWRDRQRPLSHRCDQDGHRWAREAAGGVPPRRVDDGHRWVEPRFHAAPGESRTCGRLPGQ